MHSTSVFDSFGRSVSVDFNSVISQYGGLVALVHILHKSGFLEKLTSKVLSTLPRDKRRADRVQHSHRDMFLQRLLGLLVGKEDLNDSPLLQSDPGFLAAFGKQQLASASTLCRFERSVTQETVDAGNALLLDMYLRYAPRRKYIFIDIDNTPVELFGHQEGVKFNGHYRCNCYLPLLAFIDGFPVGVFNGTQDGRKAATTPFKTMVDKIRKANPNAVIVLRADSGFNGGGLIQACEDKSCFYLIGLAPNKALLKRVEAWEPEFTEAIKRPPQYGGNLLRRLGEIDDYQAKSWNGPRRVIVRDYWSEERQEQDTRFIQTNIKAANSAKTKCGKLALYSAQQLYDLLYCARGTEEKFNQEFKVQAHGARSSSTLFLTNSYRMLLGAFCQLAYRLMRIFCFKTGNRFREATLDSVRRTFICCPASIRSFKRKIQITLSSSMLPLSGDLQRIWWGYQP